MSESLCLDRRGFSIAQMVSYPGFYFLYIVGQEIPSSLRACRDDNNILL
jgi:hypothetical protein